MPLPALTPRPPNRRCWSAAEACTIMTSPAESGGCCPGSGLKAPPHTVWTPTILKPRCLPGWPNVACAANGWIRAALPGRSKPCWPAPSLLADCLAGAVFSAGLSPGRTVNLKTRAHQPDNKKNSRNSQARSIDEKERIAGLVDYPARWPAHDLAGQGHE